VKRVKKIVCFGGGNAMPKAVLEGLKKEKGVKITSVATMFDSGGSSGQLRKEFNVLPPGDIRRHILALSEAPNWKKELWKWRFNSFGDVEVKPQPSQARHQGHNFGNVFLAGLEYILKDYQKVLKLAHDFMEVKKHRALPITIDKAQLMAELENGEIIEGEDEIDVPQKHNPNLKIKKLFLKPQAPKQSLRDATGQAKIFPETKKAILKADLITIGPGDLYSSIIACFLPEGVKEALKESEAKKIFICPAMTKLGETKDFSVKEFSDEIEKYLDFPLDFVLYNNNFQKERIEKYKKEMKKEFILDPPKVNQNLDKTKFVGKNLLSPKGGMEYDKQKLIQILRKIINF